ncbi:transcriptional regulator [Pontibacillus halophilus JSM 076056 = DSM 19796]|uniref:Transcriptional regulator n=1 Tax=Pontibacillus halophilus JSM 076056 = DSM 19796 TaxID=1385510 RepID=A0A0A5GRI8_9BACI|nr:response regulator transcription factor [Pontibacillus halophilus]KGX93785.1 transcriptional regulator [Pontibacillus halophilus JSM 076056 = DSM 19796]
MQRIAVVEDDQHIRDIVNAYLEKEGYEVTLMETAEEGWSLWESHPPDLWILDIMLPGMSGYELCKRIREESEVPIIIISARDEEVDRVLGLELGGDDYITKPFSPRELVARVNRHVKRWQAYEKTKQSSEGQGVYGNGLLRLDPNERRVFWQEEEVEVTSKEFELLSILIEQLNRAYSREELLDRVWGEDYFGSDRAVDDLVKRIRKKMPDIPIETVWGYGYRLREQGGER